MSQEIDGRITIIVRLYTAIEKILFFAKIPITVKEIKKITKKLDGFDKKTNDEANDNGTIL